MLPGLGVATGFSTLSGKSLLVARIAAIAGGKANITSLGVTSDALLDTHGGFFSIGIGNNPRQSAITPDGALLYVTNLADNTVTKYNTVTGVSSLIPVGASTFGIAMHPSGAYVLVGCSGTTSLNRIDIPSDTVTAIPIGLAPGTIAISGDGSFALISNTVNDRVTKLILSTGVFSSIPVGALPDGVAISPDQSLAYCVNRNGDSVTRIVLATSATTTINVGDAPRGVTFHPSGSFVYVTNSNDNTISKIDTITGTISPPITVGTTPFWVAFTPDGLTAFTANYNGLGLSRIDVATGLVQNIPLAMAAQHVVCTTDGALLYAVNPINQKFTCITAQRGIASLPALVGATPTPLSTGRAALQTVNGYPAAVFVNSAALSTFSVAGSAGTLICITRYTGALPAVTPIRIIGNIAGVGVLCTETGTSTLTVSGTPYLNGLPTATRPAGNIQACGVVIGVAASGLSLGGSSVDPLKGWDGPLWAWCFLATPATATQMAQIHAAFKEFFRNLPLP